MEVYRYISFERLKEVIEEKKLFFVNPFVNWPDSKEGVLYRLAQDIYKLEEIENLLSGYEHKNQIIKQLQNGGIIENEKMREYWIGLV